MGRDDVLTALANAVRRLSGATRKLGFADMTEELNKVELGSNIDGADAETDDVLSGKKFVGLAGTVQSGSMENRGAVSPSALSAGGSYTIPAGYHNGSGKVTAKSLASQTDGTATAGDVLYGKTAYVDGEKITGLMTDQGTKTATLDTSTTSYTIPAGKHSGSGKVSISTQEKSVTPSTSAQTVTPDRGKVLSKVSIGAVPSATQATPSISVDSAGKITASATQTEGYVAAGTKSATKQLTTKGAATITPSTSNQTIASGTYLTGTQTIKGDSNLKAGNIKSGVSIFGVSGSYKGTTTSSGKQVYSGTYSAYGTSVSINVGVTLSSNDVFFMIITDSTEYSTIWPVTSALRVSSGVYYVNGQVPNEDYYVDNRNIGQITYSGQTVTVTNGGLAYVFEGTFRWYIIKG